MTILKIYDNKKNVTDYNFNIAKGYKMTRAIICIHRPGENVAAGNYKLRT